MANVEIWKSLPFTRVKIEDSFWKPRLEVLKQVTLQACLQKCEETGRIANFAKAAGLLEGRHEGIYFNDSDVYKVLEGAAYSLMNNPDTVLEAEIDRIIELIAAAQEEDGTAYCETCAAIAMVFWNHRMNLLFGDAKYADVVERELYNGALAGISLTGDKFFYVNPLASKGDHHRVAWYDTSCCPTSLVRFLPSIGQYVYALSDNGIVVNQFINSEGTLEIAEGLAVNLKQTTAYPWDGRIELTVNPEKQESFTIRLRIPDWCRSYKLMIGGESIAKENRLIDRGYIVLKRTWSPDDLIVLELDMPVEALRARPEVEADRGRIAIQRGPLVYCMEQADNPDLTYDSFTVSAQEPLKISHYPELLGGVTVLSGIEEKGRPYHMIPYYAWDNREEGFMQVWIQEAENQRLYRY